MTVQAVSRYTPQYAADGAQTTFPYAFDIRDSSYLLVVIDGAIFPSTGYSVTGVGNASGGTFIFHSAPPAGQTIQAFGSTPFDQEVAYQEAGPFPAASHETGLDLGAMVTMELRDYLEMVPAYPPWFPSVLRDQFLPQPRPLGLLGWDANGEAWTTYDSAITQVTVDPVSGLAYVKNPSVLVDAVPGAWQLLASGAFPAGSRPIAAAGRIVTACGTSNGLAGVSLGDPDEGEAIWCAGMGITDDAISNLGQEQLPAMPLANPSGRDVVIAAQGGAFDAVGQIRITTWSLVATPD